MKAIVSAVLLLLGAIPLRAQGTITFMNFAAEIRVSCGGNPVGYDVGLFMQGNDIPLAVTTFIEGTGFIKPPDDDVVVPGHAVNSTDAVFIVRVWDSEKTYATSASRFESASFTAGPLGGSNGSNPPTISPDIRNMQVFLIDCPEPSSVMLGLLGFGVTGWEWRRRSRRPGVRNQTGHETLLGTL